MTRTAEFWEAEVRVFAYSAEDGHANQLRWVGFFVVTSCGKAVTLGNKNSLLLSCEPPCAYLGGVSVGGGSLQTHT